MFDKITPTRYLNTNNPTDQNAVNTTSSSLSFFGGRTWERVTNVVVLCVIASIAFLVLVFLSFYFIRRMIRKRKERIRYERRKKELRTHKKKQKFRVKHVLSEMKNWVYSQMDARYNEDQWIICLEKYEHYSELWITNEWSHSFHRKCLYEWYLNTNPTHPFRWPLWNTINRRVFHTSFNSSQNIEIEQNNHENSPIEDQRQYVDVPIGPNRDISSPLSPDSHSVTSIKFVN